MSNESLFHRLRRLAFSQSGKATGLVFVSNMVASLLGFFSTFFAIHALSISDYGIVGTGTALMTTIVAMTDFGLGTTGVRFISEYLHTHVERAHAFLKVIFRIEFALGIIILLLGLVLTPTIAHSLGNTQNSVVYLAFIGAAALSAAVFYNIVLQAYQRFAFYSALGIINGTVRLLTLTILFFAHAFTPLNVLLAYSFAPYAGLILGYIFIPRDFITPTKKEFEQQAVHDILSFGKWTMVSFVVMSIISRFDVLLLKHYTTETNVGIYNAALQLSTVLPLLIGSLTAVLLPKAGGIQTKSDLRAFARKSMAGSAVILLVLIPFVIASPILVKFILGQKYSSAVPAFQVLFCGDLLSLFANPGSVMLFRLNRPQIATFANVMQLILGTTLYFLLIPRFGVMGAAWGNFFTTVASSFVILPFVGFFLFSKDEGVLST